MVILKTDIFFLSVSKVTKPSVSGGRSDLKLDRLERAGLEPIILVIFPYFLIL